MIKNFENLYVYDVEIINLPEEVEGGWDNPEAMELGTAVVYEYCSDQYHFFGKREYSKLIKLMNKGVVVSFNGINFDNRVVKNPCWLNIDLLVEIVKSKFGVETVKEAQEKYGKNNVHNGTISLNGLAAGTLGMKKTGHGSHAPVLIREEKWAEVFSYNLHDVRLTRKLFEFAMEFGYLIDGENGKYFVDLDRDHKISIKDLLT